MSPATPSRSAEPASLPHGHRPDQHSQANRAQALRGARPLLLAISLVALLVVAATLWWKRSHVSSQTNTLEPVPATTSILVPAEPDTATSSVAAKAPDAQASAPAVLEPKDETSLAPLHAAIEQLTSRVIALEEMDRTHVEQITALRAALDQVTAARQIERDKSVERARPAVQAMATPARRPGRPTSATNSSHQATATILAVDLWGGQPSVVVGKEGADGPNVRFISQGETQGRVTLKRADVANQRATFATPTGEFTMSAGER